MKFTKLIQTQSDMRTFLSFRCSSFRLNLPHGRFFPRRSTVPQRRTLPISLRQRIIPREIPYYGIVDSEARSRLIEPSESSSVDPNILADNFVFEPPRLPEPVSSRMYMGELYPVEGIPAESSPRVSEILPGESVAESSAPVAESSPRVSEILPEEPVAESPVRVRESEVVVGSAFGNTPGESPQSPLPVIDLMVKKNDPDPGGGILVGAPRLGVLVGFQVMGAFLVEIKGRI